MMTAIMMKINISYGEINELEFHTVKNFLNTIVDMMNVKEQ